MQPLIRTLIVILTIILFSCSSKQKADLLVFNAHIYTVDSTFSSVEAMLITNGKLIATGSTKELTDKYDAAEQLDANNKFIYPGLIDAHAHFVGYGLGLQTADLVGTHSWTEILDRIKAFAVKKSDGWLIGRGWDQNDWDIKEFPDNKLLTELFPNRPVFLTRVDGHAAIANKMAIDEAGLHPGFKLTGGEVEVKNGALTGILVDNAVDLVSSKIPPPSAEQAKAALIEAQANCFAVGLTSVDDCGLDYDNVVFIDSLQKEGLLKMRIYAMLSDSKKNFDAAFTKGKIKTDFLNVRSFKVYADGALGSRGACLLQPYSDRKNWQGFLLSDPTHFDSVANLLSQKGWQMCTHAIGDSGNRMILKTYARYLKPGNDLRWRVEHAQVVDPADINLFGGYAIVPSVQPTHGTSDMYWAGDRLGATRVKSAYAYKQLLEQNGWIPLGTDFPVEDISPFKTFFAAAIRKDAKGWPAEGFQMENALTRQQAIRGMTIWAARANFEEKEKGSLEAGKFADFIILDQDLMTAAEKDLLSVRVEKTFVAGKIVFEKK